MKKEDQFPNIRYTNIPLPQTVIHYCQMYGVQRIVISAGSRNAPLTNGFVENPFFTTYSMVDERAAAFFGLGMAQQLREAVALVCTSGSALLNYYPALAEAFYSHIPLIVISADRMPHRIDIGDGQTIRQKDVFGPHLVGSTDLKPDVSHAPETLLESPLQELLDPDATPEDIKKVQQVHQEHNQSELERVLTLAIDRQGPVHLNVPMEEPLYGMTDQPLVLPERSKKTIRKKPFDINPLLEDWKAASKIMLLAGVLPPDSGREKVLTSLLQDPRVLMLSEKTSNSKQPNAIDSIDCLMAPLELENDAFEKILQPDLLITLGGMIVSKKIKAFLRKYPAKRHYHLDPINAYDTFYHLHQHVQLPALEVLNALQKTTIPKAPSDYQQKVQQRYQTYLQKGGMYLKKIPFSDLKVFSLLFDRLPVHLHIQLANSSTIRYAQLFSLPKEITVYCNRGTSGIDGSTATAVGASQIQKIPTLLITGDLSFFYDINGLWNNYIPASFRLILINNQGGGIFRILPGEKDSSKYDTYFETIHQRSARNLAKSFGFSYQKVRHEWTLSWALKRFFAPSSKPKILEIQTPRKINDTILFNYFKAMVK
ncbi:MAG: 2-succinyl-5-enolpyruvyl-6-hydroxy-3-cyclohexene-1-carboxylate synthase [Flavobacteriaceae bacterium]